MSLRTATCNLLSHAVACCDKANKLCSSHQTKVSIKCETGKLLSQTILWAHVCFELYVLYLLKLPAPPRAALLELYSIISNYIILDSTTILCNYSHHMAITENIFLVQMVLPKHKECSLSGRSLMLLLLHDLLLCTRIRHWQHFIR